jgi:superfamily I DNA/RNA helicase
MDELTGAMARAQGRIALVSGPKELMELLERPFDAWRIFLHPSQRRVAYRPSHSGPVRVTGGPGTGKTVVALHRAAHLAARLPADAPDGCILLTTYNRTLAVELERCLDLLVTDPVRRLRIRVVNVDALAYELVCNHLGVAKLNILQDQREILTRWARVVRQHGLPFADTFLDQEWRHVVLAQDLQREQDYLLASRSGRGTALGTLQRTQVWRAVEAFQQELRRDGLWTFLEVCAMAARLLDGHAGMGGSRPFRHVIVDEAQDLHPCQWRLLRAAVPAGADDLFATGDSHQRIYGNTVSLMSLGIPVTGRSYRLHVNYRSTQEIVSWAVALMVTQGPGTGTGPDGDEESLTGYYSAFSGAGPVVEGYPSKSAELAALVAAVGEWIAAGVPAEDIGVAIRFVQLGRDVTTALTAAGIPAAFLSSAAPTPEQGKGVQIGTMHRMKGLEYRCMAVVGVNDGVVPMRNAVTPLDADPQQHREDLLTELNLLFVAVTRPREALRVTWHGRPSTFLAPQ